ncbi:MAG: chloride channel protein [Promethearchaeota archaeon]
MTERTIKTLTERLRLEVFMDFIKLWVPLGVLIGSICGLIMVGFQFCVDILTKGLSPYPKWILPLFGGLFTSIMIKLGYEEVRGSGISVVVQMSHEDKKIPNRVALTKLLATIVSVGTFCPVGREGPTVLAGAGIGSFILKKMKQEHLQVSKLDPRFTDDIFYAMGSAACTAAIFKAPLGGAIFSAEVPYKRDIAPVYLPAMVSAIVSYLVFNLFYGIRPILDIPVGRVILSITMIPLVIFLGIAAGLIGVVFSTVFLATRRIMAKFLHPVLCPIVGASFTCIIIFIVERLLKHDILTVAGLGYDVIQFIGTTTIALEIIILLLIAKVLATSLTVGSGISGGVLAPSLFVGAMLGAIFAYFFSVDLGLMVFLGMTSVLCATTKSPLSASLFIVEMSINPILIIPIAIVNIVSYLFSGGFSLYESQRTHRDTK